MCADMRSRSAKKHGATEQKLFTLAAWHDGPYFSEAERAARRWPKPLPVSPAALTRCRSRMHSQ